MMIGGLVHLTTANAATVMAMNSGLNGDHYQKEKYQLLAEHNLYAGVLAIGTASIVRTPNIARTSPARNSSSVRAVGGPSGNTEAWHQPSRHLPESATITALWENR